MTATGLGGLCANGRSTELGQQGRVETTTLGKAHVAPGRRALDIIELCPI